jgi:small conductance mechanosensitive channel
MEFLKNLLAILPSFIPVLSVAAIAVVLIWALNRSALQRFGIVPDSKLPQQITMLSIIGIAVIVGVLVLPIKDETKGQLLSLFGLLLTAIIAFSSTTLVANAMAGLMLRSIRSFHPGDFIRAGEHFGRVTEQGLFHTEIQTANRDLTSIPNSYLVAQPVSVVRTSGTIIETTLSLGYDVPHTRAEELLARAAGTAGLDDAFVQILELGNFSITYRVSGFLSETKRLVSAGSALRRAVLDTLHQAGIEIASPSIMLQRPLARGERLIPEPIRGAAPRTAQTEAEDIAFDKAEQAEHISRLQHEQAELTKQIKEWEKARDDAADDAKAPLEAKIDQARKRLEDIAGELAEPKEGKE